ncbi:MAG: hypothetical protein IJI46_10500 [Erysipelotrichaceae bacterium]|nr:hypothetical protein [Erysipelotrichaceae bacterium]
MKNDIKKKFIDILFEPDDEEEEVYEKPVEVKPAKKQENTVKAKDILYRKQEKSAFIDLNEKKPEKQQQQPKQAESVYGDYEFSSQISPIFGVIKENKPEFRQSVSTNESLVSKPDNSHLEIITSPIYGYGSREDYEKDNLDINQVLQDTDEDELHRLLDEDFGYDEHTYDDLDDDLDEISLFDSFNEEE